MQRLHRNAITNLERFIMRWRFGDGIAIPSSDDRQLPKFSKLNIKKKKKLANIQPSSKTNLQFHHSRRHDPNGLD